MTPVMKSRSCTSSNMDPRFSKFHSIQNSSLHVRPCQTTLISDIKSCNRLAKRNHTKKCPTPPECGTIVAPKDFHDVPLDRGMPSFHLEPHEAADTRHQPNRHVKVPLSWTYKGRYISGMSLALFLSATPIWLSSPAFQPVPRKRPRIYYCRHRLSELRSSTCLLTISLLVHQLSLRAWRSRLPHLDPLRPLSNPFPRTRCSKRQKQRISNIFMPWRTVSSALCQWMNSFKNSCSPK